MQVFLPALKGHPPCSKLTQDLLALSAWHGGLGLINHAETSGNKYQASVKLTMPLVAIIVSQDQTREVDPADTITAKTEIR